MTVAVPPENTDVTVVVCAYTEERWSDIGRALASIEAQTRPAREVIVVIDHNPALLDRACATFAGVRVMENQEVRGLSGAKNTGLRAATSPVIAFLDDDAVADPEFLAHVERHHARPGVLGVGGFLTPEWSGPAPRWFPPEFLWVVGCSYVGQPTRAAPVRNLFGGFMSLRRDVLERVGGFDTGLGRLGTLPTGGEETELCIRAAQALPGQVFMYEPLARASHRVPACRARWRYFCSRCYHEGVSKSRITSRVGAADGLSAERAYVRQVLPRGVVRGLWAAVQNRDLYGPVRSANIVAGLLATAAGYGVGKLRSHRSARQTLSWGVR